MDWSAKSNQGASVERDSYEVVFESKLTCQFSSFFVQNFVRTMRTFCTKNERFVQTMSGFVQTTSTLYEQRACASTRARVRISSQDFEP